MFPQGYPQSVDNRRQSSLYLQEEKNLKIGVVGMGLIGGSLARTIKLRSPHQVVGCDIDPETIRLARELGALDEEMNDGNLRECDMVFVALYPQLTVDWIIAHAPLFR